VQRLFIIIITSVSHPIAFVSIYLSLRSLARSSAAAELAECADKTHERGKKHTPCKELMHEM
jgi:hypothetical protein